MTIQTEQTNLAMSKRKVRKRDISGLILCGGAARRAGGVDKGLLVEKAHCKPLIERQIKFLKPQVNDLMISANRNINIFKAYGYPVYTDNTESNFEGPLQGVLTGLKNCKTDWLYVQPIDTPNLPVDAVAQLCQKMTTLNSQVYYLSSNERAHYLHLLIHASCYKSLELFVTRNDKRVRGYLETVGALKIDLGWREAIFKNLNRLDEFEH